MQRFLPYPSRELSHEAALFCAAVNEEIEIQSGRRRGFHNYLHYDYKQRAKVARHANEYGLSAAACEFTVPVSTING